jgi:hypothetical protein
MKIPTTPPNAVQPWFLNAAYEFAAKLMCQGYKQGLNNDCCASCGEPLFRHPDTNKKPKEDPRRKDIGFDQWVQTCMAAAVIMRHSYDNLIYYDEQALRAAWIAGYNAANGDEARRSTSAGQETKEKA